MTPARPYWHPVVGRNFRMTNVTAAIGLGQVERWDEMIKARNRVAELYDISLDDSIVQRRPLAPWATEACWLYTVSATDRETVLAFLRARSIDARAIWTALPELPLYAASVRGDYSVAKQVAGAAFWLPTWAHMPEDAIMFVAETLSDFATTRLLSSAGQPRN